MQVHANYLLYFYNTGKEKTTLRINQKLFFFIVMDKNFF